MKWIAFICRFWIAAFGTLSWSAPAWLKTLMARAWQTRAGKWLNSKIQHARQQPRKAAIWVGGLGVGVVVLLTSAYYLKQYWDSLPQPDYVSVKIQPPSVSEAETKLVHGFSVVFSKSAARLEKIGKDVSSEVELKPAVPGVWKWLDDKTLNFEPQGVVAFKTDWLPGETYEVRFKKSLFPDHLVFKSYVESFKVADVTIYSSKKEFYIDPQNPSIKKGVLNFYTNYPLDIEDFKKRVSLTIRTSDNEALNGTSTTLAPRISTNPLQTEIYVETENLEIPKVDSYVTITIDKGSRATRGGRSSDKQVSERVFVPGLYSALKIDNHEIIFARNEKFEPEQVLVFETGIAVKGEDVQKALTVLLLPADHHQPNSKKVIKNYIWNSSGEVSAEVKKNSQAVELELIPTDQPYSTLHSFKVKVPVHRHLWMQLKKDLTGLGGYKLGNTYETIVHIPDYTPELLFMSEGALLTLSGEKKLPLLARNISKTKFTISRILPQQTNFLIAKMLDSGSFKKPYLYADTENMIAEKFNEEINLPTKEKAATTYFSLDMNPYIKDNKGFFYIQADGEAPPRENSAEQTQNSDEEGLEGGEGEGEGEYYSGSSAAKLNDRRLIMVTDMGLIAKHTTSKEFIVFVQNLRTGLPVEGATVEVIGQNGLSLLSETTNAQGAVRFPKMTDYKSEKKPLAFVARKNGDTSYLPYKLSDRQLLFTRFDSGGLEEDSESDQLSAMLFSDRGLYRPGEKVQIGLIVRSKKPLTDTVSFPFHIQVIDSKGTVIKKQKIPTKLFGLQDFEFSTRDTSPTGTYEVQLLLSKKVRNYFQDIVIGSTSVSIEEFVPDKLKITSQLLPFKTKGWVPLDEIKAQIQLKNLFGAPAENRLIKADYTLTPINPYISDFKDYTFINPNNTDAKTVSSPLAEGKTDAQGNISYPIALKNYTGYYLLRVKAQGYEAEGGRSVDTMISVVTSHLPWIVGSKSDGRLDYLHKDSQRKVELIALNSDYKNIEAEAQLALKQIRYVSSLVKQNDGTYKYQSIKKEYDLKKDKLKITAKGTSLPLPTQTPGDFAYIITNAEGAELHRIEFHVVGEANMARSLDRNAELQILLDKTDYNPGDEIELQIVAPYKGAGLITIEREGVFAQKWFKTSTNSTVERITIPQGLSGNAYVNVTFLRDISAKEIYMSPLSYGVRPFSINLDKQKTQITLKAPEKVRPGEDLKIEYSANRATTLILYGVDEGILQVARYKLPQPLNYFFQKRALQVDTYQLLDLLLPEYSLLKDSTVPGGDGSSDAGGDNLNPFRVKGLAPVVFWSGPLTVDQNSKTFKYTVPDYFNGRIKIMAVASSLSGLGSAETGAFSRGDFIITPTAPVFVTPADEIHVGVNVSNQIENPKSSPNVKLSVKTSSGLSVVGAAEQSLTIAQGREVGSSFVFRVKNELGAAEMMLTATNGKEVGSFKHALSVRPATPLITSFTNGMADKLPLELPIPRRLYAEKAVQSLELSGSPLKILESTIGHFLEDYSYLCTEQLVSKAIGKLAFSKTKKTATAQKEALASHEQILEVLRTRKTSDEGFALYPGGSTSTVVTLYAIHYLLTAQQFGFAMPEDMNSQFLTYLKSSALRKTGNLQELRIFAQALYLQARMGVVPSNDLTFLVSYLDKNLDGKSDGKSTNDWKTDVIAIYIAGTYQLLQQADEGWRLLKGLSLNQSAARDYFSFLSPVVRDATLVQIVSTHYPDKISTFLNNDNLRDFLKKYLAKSLNTIESAQLALVLYALQKASENKNFPGQLQVKQWMQTQEKLLPLKKEPFTAVDLDLKADRVTVLGDDTVLPFFYSMKQKGFDSIIPKTESKQDLEVQRVFENEKGETVSKIKMGEEVAVTIRWRTTSKTYLPYVLIVDLLPAGFEIIRQDVQSASLDFLDLRDDRTLAYTHASEKMLEYKYKIKATNKGKFTVPPIYAEFMYDSTIHYRGVGSTFEIQ